MKIALVNPNVLSPAVFPAGLEYSAEFLRNQGHDVTILDLNINFDIKPVKRHELVLVGIRNLDSGPGNQESEINKIANIISKIRLEFSGPIGIAGTAVNIVPEALRSYLGVDYALVSKGFGALQELVTNISNGNNIPEVIVDYSDYLHGYFRRDSVSKTLYIQDGGRIGVATKFGCIFSCEYCNYPDIDGRKIILRSPEEIIDEISNLMEAGIQRIFFCDSQFNTPVKHAIDILQKLLNKNLIIDWDGFHNPHPKVFTEKYVQLIRKFGKKQVHLGIDSLSDHVLRNTRKGFSVSDVKQAVVLCREYGMDVSCSLLFGHPSETVNTVKETFRHVDEIGFSYVDVSPAVRIYPRTRLQIIAVREGIISQSDDLLMPTFYPVSHEVSELIQFFADEREECHTPGIEQYISLS